jgi:group I intron endonuclease
MKKISGIYKITNSINGKIYIGSAQWIHRRWDRHRSDLNLQRHGSRHLQRSFNKHGMSVFIFEVIEECSVEDLLVREQYYLDLYKSFDPKIGYNISPTAGSNLGWKATDETRKRMSDSRKGIPKTAAQNEANRKSMIALNRTGLNNPASKIFYLTDPEGNQHEVKGGLKKFCTSKGIRYSSINEVGHGLRDEYRGWTAYKIVPNKKYKTKKASN